MSNMLNVQRDLSQRQGPEQGNDMIRFTSERSVWRKDHRRASIELKKTHTEY